MRKVNFLAVACLVGICCWASSPVLAGCTASRYCDYGPPISCSNSSNGGSCSSGSAYGGWINCGTGYQFCPPAPVEGEPYCEEAFVQACDEEGDCTAYCEATFTGIWLQMECDLDSCCRCIDLG